VLSDELVTQVSEELNVKALEVLDDLEGLLDYVVTPNFRRLGPRVGPRIQAVKAALAAADGATLQRALTADGTVVLDVEGELMELGVDDVEVRARAHEEFVLAEDGGLAVAIDTRLDDELRAEGIARELARGLNELRKTNGFDLADRIRVTLRARGPVAAAARGHQAWIAEEVLATDFQVEETDAEADGFVTLDVDGAPVGVRVARA
jgi:isoleucyl-tRNA synthetase